MRQSEASPLTVLMVGVELGGKRHTCLVPDFPSVKFSEALAASILVLTL